MPSEVALWKAEQTDVVPKGVNDASAIAGYARQLRARDINQIVGAFNSGNYEMVSGFVLARTIAVLRKQLATLGMDFIGEMLARPDIDDSTPVNQALTEYQTLVLAEDLAMVSPTEALRLRQCLETYNHFAENNPELGEEEMTPEEAIHCLRSSVQAVLGKPRVDVAVEFATFRKHLRERTFKPDDAQIKDVVNSPYFFRRTTLNLLLATLKGSEGAFLEHAVGNLNVIVPLIWDDLRKPEKWNTGHDYAALVSAGRNTAATGLKKALVAVRGFDYVPENLRSNSFIAAANDVISAHEAFNNFHNEPAPMRALASLGTSIPMPAFPKCMSATLAVFLGNTYGRSWAAVPSAEEILKSLSADQWQYYLDECLPGDKLVLQKLFFDEKPRQRWCELATAYELGQFEAGSRPVRMMLKAAVSRATTRIAPFAGRLLSRLGYKYF